MIAAQQTAAFQEKLISALQAIEQTLEGIKNDLDAIYQELKNVEQDIEGLGLNDKLTAIDTWGMELAALDAKDTHGAQTLAAAMLDASQGATNLIGCMMGIHNAMVGETIGTPLINLMDAPSFIRMRARLVRGLQLLAFATAFNNEEKYDYGVFLLQWAVNFRQQTDLYFAAKKDQMVLNYNHYVFNAGWDIKTNDCIALYRYAQPQLDNVAVAMVRPGYAPLLLYSGTMLTQITDIYDDGKVVVPVLNFDVADPLHMACYIDLLNNEFSTDPNSPLAKECLSCVDVNRYWIFWPGLVSGGGQIELCSMVCGARYKVEQTFLGGAAGQVHWLEATGDNSSLVSSIYDGITTDAALVTYDADSKGATTKPFAGLHSMSEALWTTTWDGGGAITVVLSAAAGDPIYLGIDAAGNWQLSAAQQAFGITEFPDPVPGPITNPLQMPPTPVTLKSSMGGQKSVLFRQF